MSVIAVVGATGTIGSRVVAGLSAQGYEVRAISSNPDAEVGSAEIFTADLTDADQALAALGREVNYHEADVSTRDYVEAFPISDPHKDIYAGLFDHFRSTTYLGDPEPIIETLDGFEPRGLDDFMQEELFATT